MQDPLSFNVPTAGIDTSFPLIPEGDYELQITESNFGPSNFDKEVLAWSPKLVTTTPITSVDGRSIPVGSQVYLKAAFDLQEQADSKYPGSWIISLCSVVDAIHGTNKDTRPDVNKTLLDSSVGKKVIGHVIIDEDKRDGTKRNKIKKLKSLPA